MRETQPLGDQYLDRLPSLPLSVALLLTDPPSLTRVVTASGSNDRVRRFAADRQLSKAAIVLRIGREVTDGV
jgi:hypothetical protein